MHMCIPVQTKYYLLFTSYTCTVVAKIQLFAIQHLLDVPTSKYNTCGHAGFHELNQWVLPLIHRQPDGRQKSYRTQCWVHTILCFYSKSHKPQYCSTLTQLWRLLTLGYQQYSLLLWESQYSMGGGGGGLQHGYWKTCILGYLELSWDVPSEGD